MPDPPNDRRRTLRPPEEGWTFGAAGLSRAAWLSLAGILLALAVLLFALAYFGYAAVIAILAAAAAVNIR